MTVMFREYTWWPVGGTESGASDTRLSKWALEGCAFFVSVSVSPVFSLPLVVHRIWVGRRLSCPGKSASQAGFCVTLAYRGQLQAPGLCDAITLGWCFCY